MTDVLRTKTKGVYKLKLDPFGAGYVPVPDPDGTTDEIPPYAFDPKYRLDRVNWNRIMRFFYDLMDPAISPTGGISEAQVVIARSFEAGTYRCFVPRQQVDRVSVDADLTNLVCLETGEKLTAIPRGYGKAGTAHSHNSIPAVWSGTDNEDQRRDWGVHFVAGELDSKGYRIAARIARKGGFVDLKNADAVDSAWVHDNNYAREPVLAQLEKPKVVTMASSFDYGGWMFRDERDPTTSKNFCGTCNGYKSCEECEKCLRCIKTCPHRNPLVGTADDLEIAVEMAKHLDLLLDGRKLTDQEILNLKAVLISRGGVSW